MSERAVRGWLLAITAIAAALRLAAIGIAPPGLNQDEAIGAWISWCLLKTGHDMSGQPWPIFYAHGIGDIPSTLFFYITMPFQAVGGLNVLTTRLPAAFAGIACVPLLYYVGSRMFGPATGLVAAAVLALDPWHLFLSRFGVGASQCPLHALIPIAMLIRARLPLTDAPPQRSEPGPDPRWAGAAGLAAGIACYGFHPMRLYFPVLFLLLALLLAPVWWRTLRDPRGRIAILSFALGFAVTFGPLAWQHRVDPQIAHRWEMTRLWPAGTPPLAAAAMVARRWLEHFHPDFLFVTGDRFEIMQPIGQGEFGWHLMPAMVAGLVFLVLGLRKRRAARVLLALLIAYPAGDVISRYLSVHSLRSAPGVPALALLAGWGAVEAHRWIRARWRSLAPAVAALWIAAGLFLDGRHATRFFGEWNRRLPIYHSYHADLLEVAEWLEPRLRDVDAVFCTVNGLNQPWSVLAVGAQYDPRQWMVEPKDRRELEYDLYVRHGKMHYLYGDLWVPHLEALTADDRPQRVLFIVRPGELQLEQPMFVVRRPDGREALWVVGRVL